MKLIRFLITALLGAGVYLLLAASVAPAELALAAAVGVLAALLSAPSFSIGPRALHPVRLLRALWYVPYFLAQMIWANLKIAAVVLSPRLPVRPSIVRAPNALRSPAGTLLLTSSITLTPGTLTVEVEDDRIYIHCVQATQKEDEDPRGTITGGFEKRLKGVTE
jgi:multicomponent Na+:H+ antiporter subunit E